MSLGSLTTGAIAVTAGLKVKLKNMKLILYDPFPVGEGKNISYPPRPLPDAAIPLAMGSLVLNQSEGTITARSDRHPAPSPTRTP